MEVAVAGAADLGRYGRRIVKMIWDPEPTNDATANQPIWCLGCSYMLDTNKTTRDDSRLPSTSPNTLPPDTVSSATQTPAMAFDTPPDSTPSSFTSLLAYDDEDGTENKGWPGAFLDDFESRLWMTYRSGFESIARSEDPKAYAAMSFSMRLKTLGEQSIGFSSDSGWGCMIRSGQSLLANALSFWKLGRDWRLSDGGVGEKEIVSMFSDDPRAPFSIHSFVGHGAIACGKYPGEWFGPSATAVVSKSTRALANSQAESLRVYATGDLPDVYEDSFFKVAKPKPNEEFHPTLILVGTRLGIDKVNTVYWEALTSALQMPQSVGIAGGRPSSSHYFVGCQRSTDDHGSYLFYLDPHYTRPALVYHEDPKDYTQEELGSCHTRRLRRLHVREMDPSMLIGFLIKNEEDWDSWKSSVKHVQGKAIITVSDHDPASGMGAGREGAIDEVETLSDDDMDTILGL